MKNIDDISAELNSMGSSLAGMSRKMPYVIPPDYQERFRRELLHIVAELEVADQLPSVQPTIPFTVPDGYFAHLTDDAVSAALASSVADTYTKNNPFAIPAGYFDALPGQILKKAQKPRRIALQPLRSVKWAAAAVVLVCITLGSYISFFSPERPGNPEHILASVSSNEIQDYFQHTYRLDADRIVGNNDVNSIQVSNKDIIDYLNETGWDNAE